MVSPRVWSHQIGGIQHFHLMTLPVNNISEDLSTTAYLTEIYCCYGFEILVTFTVPFLYVLYNLNLRFYFQTIKKKIHCSQTKMINLQINDFKTFETSILKVF